MLKIKILSIILLLAAMNVSAQTYSGGSGTAADPYLISSKADMVALANAVNSGTTYTNKYFRLTQSLTGANTLTTSVGSVRFPFQGVFDGGGYEIGLNNAPTGVFGNISNATIQNLSVSGMISASTSSSYLSAGGICGDSESSTIVYCSNAATVSAISTYNGANDGAPYALCSAGGICGYASVTTIMDCSNQGAISSSSNSSNSLSGGICGALGGSISNCYNIGNVSAVCQSNVWAYAGGIIGIGGGISQLLPIQNCFSANSNIEAMNAVGSENGYNVLVGRIAGGYDYDDFLSPWHFIQTLDLSNNYALSTMTVNGSSVNISNAMSKNGEDATLTNFKSQSWIQSNLGWDFNTVWQMSSSSSSFQGFPILKPMSISYTITASASSGGLISPNGAISVNQGESKTFTITPNTGYDIDQVLVDGTNNATAVSAGSYTFTNVTANHTISVSFKQKPVPTYTITASSNSGGSISPSGAVSVSQGDSKPFTFTPNTGYDIDQVLIDGINNATAVSAGSYTFTNVTANHTISVSFKQKPVPTYTITASAGSGGSISPSGVVSVNQGESKTFTITPNTGYDIDQVLIDGINNATAVSAGSYTFTNVTSNHTISVSFKQKPVPTYMITASSGSGGNISPSGAVSVSQGDSKTFTFTPNTGYDIDQVLIDGTNNATAVSAGSYTFTNVTANHTISVSFKQKPVPTYTITASSNSGGSISPSGVVSVSQGDSKPFTFTPNTGYDIDQVLIDGANNATAVSAGSYTFTNVTSNHTISVLFKQKPVSTYTITASSGSGGNISPSGAVSVNQGDSITFTFTPNTGYDIDQVLVDGTNNASAVSAGSYTFTNVTTNHTISVTFKQTAVPTYTITASASSGGSISPNGNVSVNQGDSKTFTLTPNSGYDIDQVLVDGTNNATAVSAGSYTFTNVTANHTISVSFKQQAVSTYTITASAGSGGVISPSGAVSVNQGDSKPFTFTPNTGYDIDQVLIDGTNNATAVSAGNYTFTNVTANHTITVSFKQKPVQTYTITASASSGGVISPSGAVSVNQGDSKPFTFTPNTNYSIADVLIDGVSNASAKASGSYTFTNVTSNHTISVSFAPECLSNIIVQVWDDVLSVINNPANNGGYTFTGYQWLKNGVEIAGETSGNLYLTNDADKTMSDYTCRVTTSNGQTLQSCPLQVSAKSSISAYPNPTDGTIIVESSALKEGDKINVYCSAGTLVKQYLATPNQTKIDLGNQPKGVYIIKVNGKQVKIILL